MAIELPVTTDRVLVAVNPRAGARSGAAKVSRLVSMLAVNGQQVEVISDCGQLSQAASTAIATGSLRGVVAAGGDGTVAEVVNRCPPGTPVAILPLGTENLLAKYLGQDPAPEAVGETILSGKVVCLDAGLANGRIFTLMVSAGVDAEVIRRLHESRSGHITHWTYAKPIWDSFRSYTYPELRIYCRQTGGEAAQRIDAHWVIGVNLPQYARGLKFAPAASGTDGLFDICTFRSESFCRHLWHLAGVVAGRHQTMRDCTTGRYPRLRIESDAPAPYQLDGDVGGWLPVEVEILPKRLRLLVPQTFVAADAISLT